MRKKLTNKPKKQSSDLWRQSGEYQQSMEGRIREKKYVLSLEWKSEGVIDHESGEDGDDELTGG